MQERTLCELDEMVEAERERTWLATIATQTRLEATYRGVFDDRGQTRIVYSDILGTRPVTHHVRHSPNGLAWGYLGSGPADAARCILADALGLAPLQEPTGCFVTGDFPEIGRLYQRFKSDVIARFPANNAFELPYRDVIRWYNAQPDELKPRLCRTCRAELDEGACWTCAQHDRTSS